MDERGGNTPACPVHSLPPMHGGPALRIFRWKGCGMLRRSLNRDLISALIAQGFISEQHCSEPTAAANYAGSDATMVPAKLS